MIVDSFFLDAGGPVLYIGAILVFIVLPVIALALLIYLFNRYRKKKQQH